MYYLILPSLECRQHLIVGLKAIGVNSVFHYVPLHSAPAGKRYARCAGPMTHTEDLSDRLVRLPLWVGLDDVDRVAEEVLRILGGVE